MNKLTFLVEDVEGARAIVPCIDDAPLTRLIAEFEIARGYTDPAGGYGGLIPEFFSYGPLDVYFSGRAGNLGEGGTDNEIYVLGCECGEVGCWPLMVQVTDDGSGYRWNGFRQPHRKLRDYSDFGQFHFERDQYLGALRALCGQGDR